MAIQVQGGTSGVVADVNALKELTVAARVVDRRGDPIAVTEDDFLKISPETLLFFEQVDGATLNSARWAPNSTTMTITQATGFMLLNASAITTINTNANITSIRQFPLYGSKPLRVQFNAKTSVGPQANATMEMGLGFVATNSAPTDGAFFRWSSAGTFMAVVNRAGNETLSATLTAPAVNVTTLFEIVIVEDLVQFIVDDAVVAEVAVPTSAAYPVDSGHQPVFARVYTAGSVPGAAPQISIGQVCVIQESLQQNKRWSDILASLGQSAYQSPSVFTQTANFANSAAPASATLSNTAAGYTTLGGLWQFVAVAGAETDYALFGYQVPVGFQFYVTGIAISAMNTVVAVATTPTVLEWGIGVNSSGVSLATPDAATTWAPRRQHLGFQSFPVGAAVGATATDIVQPFDPPLIVDSGRFFHIILRMPIATATATEIFRGGVTVRGYFE